jgi:hypothetical protein
VLENPSVFVRSAVKGFLDDIYATLIVTLPDAALLFRPVGACGFVFSET